MRRLLIAIGWEALFEVELIQSGPEEFVPIDLNPRPYGSMALAVAAGAPLVPIWCDWLFGRNPRPVRALAGHRYRWEDGDLRHLLWQLRHGNYRPDGRRRRSRTAMSLTRTLSSPTRCHSWLADSAWRAARRSAQLDHGAEAEYPARTIPAPPSTLSSMLARLE